MELDTYKVCLVGDARAGKTSLAHVLLFGQAPIGYNPTICCEIHPIVYHRRQFNLWDTAGQKRFRGLRNGYYIQAQIGIVMYDNPQLLSRRDWARDLRRVSPHMPIIKCVNVSAAELQPNQPENHLFFVDLLHGTGVDQLLDHMCCVAH